MKCQAARPEPNDFPSLFFYSVYFPKYGKWEEWIKEQERELVRK
jgi:hypothetical protein